MKGKLLKRILPFLLAFSLLQSTVYASESIDSVFETQEVQEVVEMEDLTNVNVESAEETIESIEDSTEIIEEIASEITGEPIENAAAFVEDSSSQVTGESTENPTEIVEDSSLNETNESIENSTESATEIVEKNSSEITSEESAVEEISVLEDEEISPTFEAYELLTCTENFYFILENNKAYLYDYCGDDVYTITSLTIPAQIHYNGKAYPVAEVYTLFESLWSLEHVTIDAPITSLPQGTFCYCTSLKSVTLPEELQVIGGYAFAYCESLKSITLPNKLTAIENNAFYACGLKEICIPDSVTYMGITFEDCTSLEHISFGKGLTSISTTSHCYGLSNLKSIYVPSEVTTLTDFSTTYPNVIVYCPNGTDTSQWECKNIVFVDDTTVKPAAFSVKGIIGGRAVTFKTDSPGAVIYYSTTTSQLTTTDKCVANGETVNFDSFYGTVYARAYSMGKWSNVSRLILKIPTVNAPTITNNGNRVTIRTSTPQCTIYYTTDGSTPSPTNGTKIAASTGSFLFDKGTVKAIAVRSCFTNSTVVQKEIKPVIDSTIGVPSFQVKGVVGGRNVTFNSNTKKGVIYYSTTTSSITVADKKVANGKSVLFENFYGTVYARTYYNGKWSNVSRLVLKIPTVKAPAITFSGARKATIKTATPNARIYYTTDGTTPSVTNGKCIYGSSGTITCKPRDVIQAIAVRSCFTNSPATSAQAPYEIVKVSGTQKYDEAYEVLNLLNALRKEQGLGTVVMDQKMMEAAMLRAAECSLRFSHDRPNGSSYFTVLPDGFDEYISGENIYAGPRNAAQAMLGWTDSPSHYAIMTNFYYDSVGIGCFEVNGYKYWVQLFSGKVSKNAAQPDNRYVTVNVETIDW